jgi:hypothetical protein
VAHRKLLAQFHTTCPSPKVAQAANGHCLKMTSGVDLQSHHVSTTDVFMPGLTSQHAS